MEIRNILTFLRVAECESFTKAAEELGYVQSTVSMQIQQLEDQISTRLFERIGKRVALTDNGRAFMEYANQIVQLTQQAALLGKAPREIVGKLRIGILESLLEWVVPECIPQFYQQFPQVSIETRAATGTELFQMLRHNELDFIFLLDRKISEKNCTRAFAARERMVFVTAPGHPLTQSAALSLSQVAAYPLVLTERDGVYRRALEDCAANLDMYIAPFLEVNNTTAIVRLLQKGLGVSFLPEYVVRESVRQGRLSLLPVEDCPMEFWSQIFYHSKKWVTPQMEGLIQIIQTHHEKRCATWRAV